MIPTSPPAYATATEPGLWQNDADVIFQNKRVQQFGPSIIFLVVHAKLSRASDPACAGEAAAVLPGSTVYSYC